MLIVNIGSRSIPPYIVLSCIETPIVSITAIASRDLVPPETEAMPSPYRSFNTLLNIQIFSHWYPVSPPETKLPPR